MTLWQRWRGGRDGGDGSCPRILWTESWSEDLRLSTQRHWWDFAWPRRHMRPETGLVLPSIIIGSICVVSILQFLLFQNWPWHPHSFEATALEMISSHDPQTHRVPEVQLKKIGWWQPPRPCEAKSFIAKSLFCLSRGLPFFLFRFGAWHCACRSKKLCSPW